MRKRKSCFNIKLAIKSCFYHNSREITPQYLVDSIERNSYDRNAKEAQEYYSKLIKEATIAYMKRTKQKLQVSEKKFLWEAVIVLDYFHTFSDVKKLVKFLNKNFGWQDIQIALHRDEGYIDEITNEIIYNYHAHIVFFMLNKKGIYSLKKRDFGKKRMSQIQTEVAKILRMQRGESKEKTGRKRLTARQYRQVAKEKYDLKFEIRRISDESDMFQDAMLNEYDLRCKAEDELKKLQDKIKIFEKEKNILSSDDMHKNDSNNFTDNKAIKSIL